VYDHPFQWGSKRTGPDLARVGGRYSDEWHRTHLINPRDLVPESNMPAYPWLDKNLVDAASLPAHMRALRTVGVPYTDEQIAKAPEEVKGKTEMDATIAYLQDTTGHVWDGDLREMNNPLPRWWVYLFVITIIFSLVYLALYPGLGSYAGHTGLELAPASMPPR
jgi:cbb3-type cytochrome oxidase cytochrome c subunit